jgi:hypothetical protein
MKKIFLFALAAAVLCLPMTAQAKAEFELGGYIRMDALWNSNTGAGHTLAGYLARGNTANSHGRMQFNANATRFNFTIKGPEVWGGKVTGFMEVDFDGQPVNVVAVNRATTDSPFIQAKIRLRHAMFKITWPDRELLFGQYWSINSELPTETADSGGFCAYGATQLRVPQIRYTHKFGNGFDASLAIEEPVDGRWGLNLDNTNPNEGETSEVPMVEAKVRYEQDLWGKGAFYGKPRGFYVGLGAGYLRTRNVAANFGNPPNFYTWGQNGFSNQQFGNAAGGFLLNNAQTAMNYADHWLVLLENVTPIIPTYSKSLAGTLTLSHQWWIGQGVSAWRLDYPGNDRFYNFRGTDGAGNNFYEMDFIKRWGGNLQLQYYWTEEIFTNVNAGLERAFDGPGYNRNLAAFNPTRNPNSYVIGLPNGYDPVKGTWRISVTQWYRPVPAIKFGLQYAFMRTDYFQVTGAAWNTAALQSVVGQTSAHGINHSIFTTGYFFF